jgi:hypothetical protein
MIRDWSFLEAPSVVGLGPPLSASGESSATADTAASRILMTAVTIFIVAFFCMWVVLFSRLDL